MDFRKIYNVKCTTTLDIPITKIGEGFDYQYLSIGFQLIIDGVIIQIGDLILFKGQTWLPENVIYECVGIQNIGIDYLYLFKIQNDNLFIAKKDLIYVTDGIANGGRTFMFNCNTDILTIGYSQIILDDFCTASYNVAPNNGSYLVVNFSPLLPNERRLISSINILTTDGGPGSNFSLDLANSIIVDNINERTLNNGVVIEGSTLKDGDISIVNVPTQPQHATNKQYVDTLFQGWSFQEAVLEIYDPTGGLPIGPSVGDRYIAYLTANGWISQHIYQWNGALWIDIVPAEGWITYVEGGAYYPNNNVLFNGTVWVQIASTLVHSNLQHLVAPYDDHTQYMLVPTNAVVDNHIARWDTASGRQVQTSNATIDDLGNVSGIGNLTMSGLVASPTGTQLLPQLANPGNSYTLWTDGITAYMGTINLGESGKLAWPLTVLNEINEALTITPTKILSTTGAGDLQAMITTLVDKDILEIRADATYSPIIIPGGLRLIIRGAIGYGVVLTGANCITISNGTANVTICNIIIDSPTTVDSNGLGSGICMEHLGIISHLIFYGITIRNAQSSGVLMAYHQSVGGDDYVLPNVYPGEFSNQIAFVNCSFNKATDEPIEGGSLTLRGFLNPAIAKCNFNMQNVGGRGIQLQNCMKTYVTENYVINGSGTANGEGIKMDRFGTPAPAYFSSGLVTFNTVKNCKQGIDIDDCDYASVIGNTSFLNTNEGICVCGADNCNVISNVCYNNNDGIAVEIAATAILKNNVSFSNTNQNYRLDAGGSPDNSNSSIIANTINGADSVAYNNATSNLTATLTQNAIDEIRAFFPAVGASTDEAIARYDNANGKLQNSTVTINDGGKITSSVLSGQAIELSPGVASTVSVGLPYVTGQDRDALEFNTTVTAGMAINSTQNARVQIDSGNAGTGYEFNIMHNGYGYISGTKLFSVKDNGSIYLGTAGNEVNEFSIDGTLAGNSDLALPTEQAVKTYVDTTFTNQGALLNEPTGFSDTARTNTTITYVNGATPSITITPTGTQYYYIKGIRYTLNVAKTCTYTLPLSEGLHHIYLNTAGNLLESSVLTLETLLKDYALVSEIYWDATNLKHIYVGDERHEFMQWETHYYLHTKDGTAYKSGLALNSITADGGPPFNVDALATIGVDAGVLLDEDLTQNITPKISPAPIYVYYRNASGYWRQSTPVTNAPVVKGVNRLYYNPPAGGLTEIGSENQYVLTHIIATNNLLATGWQIIALMGQAVYTSITSARTGANNEVRNLIISGLPTAEFIFVASIIYQTNSTYGNTWNARIRTTDIGTTYISWLQRTINSTAVPFSHSNLANLLNDDHTQYMLDPLVAPTDNAIARWDGITGRYIQSSAITVADTTAIINFLPTTGLLNIQCDSFKTILTNSKIIGSIAIGYTALNGYNWATEANPGHFSNIAIGNQSGHDMSGGYLNVLVGSDTGYDITDGYNNTIIGTSSGLNITTGINNTFIGTSSGTTANNILQYAIGIGYSATTETNYYVQIGKSGDATHSAKGYFYSQLFMDEVWRDALVGIAKIDGTGNFVKGTDAITAGTDNHIVRWNGTTGLQDSAITIADTTAIMNFLPTTGLLDVQCDTVRSIYMSTTASGSTRIGRGALAGLAYAADTNYNVAIGEQALHDNSAGTGNIAVGYNAGPTSTGTNNTYCGRVSGDGITTGNGNVSIGSGSGCTGLAALSNSICLGNNAKVGNNYYVQIGESGLATNNAKASFYSQILMDEAWRAGYTFSTVMMNNTNGDMEKSGYRITDGTHTTNWSGPWAVAQACNVYWARSGRIITLTLEKSFNAVYNSSTFITMDTALASELRPRTTGNVEFPMYVMNNGSIVLGRTIIASATGVITIYVSVATNFTGASNVGVDKWTVSYVSEVQY
jgi:parallel beta-helix repeat protein